MTKPATDLSALPWSDAMPDQEGYWWFRHRLIPDVEDWGFVQRVWPHMLEEGEDLWLDALDISKMTPERWEDEGWQCCPVVLPIPVPITNWPENVPEECPRCGAKTQWTYLTPPDDGIAYGCTACRWPLEETA